MTCSQSPPLPVGLRNYSPMNDAVLLDDTVVFLNVPPGNVQGF
jgi:hypothetical protein